MLAELMEVPTTITAPARLSSPYTFDTRLNGGRGAYRSSATGRAASWREVRGWLDGYIESAREEAASVADAVIDGRLTLAEAELRMRDITANAHIAAAVLERGGFAQMSPADYGRVGRRLFNPAAPDTPEGRERWGQYQYLRNRFREIESGRQPMDGTLRQRLMAYVDTARTTYHRAEMLRMAALGYDQVRRLLHAQDSCTTADSRGERMGCRDLAAAGWMLVEEMTPIGDASCRSACKCSLLFRNSTTGRVFEA
jgi:hypothetical protein